MVLLEEQELEIMGINMADFISYKNRVRSTQTDVRDTFNSLSKDVKLEVVGKDTVEEYIKAVKSDWYNEFADTDLREDKKSVARYIQSIRELRIETSGIRYWIVINGIRVGGVFINLVFAGKEANVGYFLYPKETGKGIMTYVLDLLSKVLSGICKYTYNYDVTFKIQRNNTKSWNIMQRLNYQIIDVQKGKHCNNVIYKAR